MQYVLTAQAHIQLTTIVSYLYIRSNMFFINTVCNASEANTCGRLALNNGSSYRTGIIEIIIKLKRPHNLGNVERACNFVRRCLKGKWQILLDPVAVTHVPILKFVPSYRR